MSKTAFDGISALTVCCCYVICLLSSVKPVKSIIFIFGERIFLDLKKRGGIDVLTEEREYVLYI